MEKVCVLGSINIDFVSYSSRYPYPGETFFCDDFGIFQGGKGANQAIALAKMDVPTAMLGKIGNDMLGDFALSFLKQNGVNAKRIFKASKTSTGSASIWVNAEGQNSILVFPGANGKVDKKFIEENKAIFAEASYFLAQFEVPLDSVDFALNLAKKKGLKTFLDPAPVKKIFNSHFWKNVDYLIPNEIELKALANTNDILDGIQYLKRQGVGEVIVKLGENGAGYETNGRLEKIPAIKVGGVIDTTGAGDCFVAGFIYSMTQISVIPKAIRMANLAASYAIQKKGAAVSFPAISEIKENFLD